MTGLRGRAGSYQYRRESDPKNAYREAEAVLLLIGRRAARDFAAHDPVFVGVTRHRPLRVGVERLLVAPLLDQKDVLVVVFRQHQVELQAAVITARALRMPAHQVDELATVLRLRFELDDDHDLAHRRSFLDDFGHRCAIRHVKASARSENCGNSTMAYDAMRTIMPIAGWPEERAREVEISVGADPVLPTRFRIGRAGLLRETDQALRACAWLSRPCRVSFGDPGRPRFLTPLRLLPLEQDAPRVALALQRLSFERSAHLSRQVGLRMPPHWLIRQGQANLPKVLTNAMRVCSG